ncbi:MAG TPA: PEP-utilizing enzyme [Candidatus Nanoarchaeia archaeon]|nr:PEP-utilizing enzyme [Candidatus Nanoarchaeia archaeon]
MKKTIILDRISGIDGCIYLTSPIPQLISWSNKLFRLQFGDYAIGFHDERNCDEYVSFEYFRKQSELLAQMFLKAELTFPFFSNVHKNLLKGISLLDTLAKQKLKGLRSLPDRELIASYTVFMKDYTYYYGWGAITFIYEQTLAEMLASELQSHVKNPSESIMSYIHSKNKRYESFMLRYDKAIGKLSKKDDKKLRHGLIENFYYIKSSYFDAPVLDNPSIDKDIREFTSHKKKVAASKVDIKHLSQREKIMLRILAASLPLRDTRKQLNLIGDFIMMRFLEEALRRKGILDKLALFKRIFWPEYKEIFDNPGKLESRLKKRTAATLYINPKSEKFYLGYLAVKERSSGAGELKGLVASKGRVTGSVRVIHGSLDFHLFQKGEILVTDATRPDFVPIMKRAKAILTQEGGLTSHTAIVSRELHIPCIVGIPGVTVLLKDGDRVEVDANKGVVRKV